MIGTSDRLCWLAETCKILVLLLLLGAKPAQLRTAERSLCWLQRRRIPVGSVAR